MPITVATVRDLQSAEYIKSRALVETDPEVELALWRQARHLDPDSATLHSHEAFALLGLRRFEDVVRVLGPALSRWPRMVHIGNVLGVALCELGHFKGAAQLFEHVLRLDPEYPNGKGNLTTARRASGRSKPVPPRLRQHIDQAIAEARASRRPTLAVCMIVKNESEFIEGALNSVRKIANEMIVVDTGSDDDTVAIAERCGAQVHYFPWTGDFSAARNASLAPATTDWVLVLDADERLTEASRTPLRAVMEEYWDPEDLRVVCVKIHNLTRDGRFMSDGFSGRLFQNHPDMRFDGRVHEEVARGRADVSTDYRLDVVFDHYGADPEVMREKAKDERNIELLEHKLADAPDDLLTWFYLASQHWVGRRRSEAGDAFRRVIELYERNPSRYGLGVRNVPVPYSYVGLVRALMAKGESIEALKYGQKGLSLFPENPDLWFHTGHAHIGADQLDAAHRAFKRALDAQISGYALIGMHDKSIKAWRALKMVADIDFELERSAEAYAGYLEVFPNVPSDHTERYVIAARLVELCSAQGDIDRLAEHTITYVSLRPLECAIAVQAAQQLASVKGLQAAYDLLTNLYAQVEATRESMELVLAIGQIAEQAEEVTEALRWYQQGLELSNEEPRLWLKVAQLCAKTGDSDAANEAFGVAQRLLNMGSR